VPQKIGGSPRQQERVNYAWKISGGDETFIYLLECENGLWSEDRRHDPSMNTVGVDYGWGINDYWHRDIVWADGDRFFSDWRWNLEQTYNLYKNGTKFYGLNNIGVCKTHFL